LPGIFVSYTSGDRDWAFWIAKAIETLGYKAFVHDWETHAGEDILAWMERRFDEADHALLVISGTYLGKEKEYSSWERRAAQWAAAKQSGFALPVYVERCEAPRLLQNFKRCDLYDLDEDGARATLAEYLAPPGPPSGPWTFPGRSKLNVASTAPESVPSVASTAPESVPSVASTAPESVPSVASTTPESVPSVASTTPKSVRFPGRLAGTGFPLTHEDIDTFTIRSAALGDILFDDEAARIVEAYEREDQRAIDRQKRFFMVAARLNRTILTTAVIGTLILALGVLMPWLQQSVDPRFDQVVSWIVAALGFIGILVGGYAAALLYELNAGDLEGDWMQSRARAEQLRSEYFDRLVARAAKSDSATQTTAFDLVKTHLLQDQLNYFANRGKRHEALAAYWLRLAVFATGVASVGVAAGGMVGAVGGPRLLAIAALGTIGTAVVSFAISQQTIGQERERAQRYRNNVDALELVARQAQDVRDAIDKGSAAALVTFTSTINQQLALELGRFLEGGESIRASIAKLNAQIEPANEVRVQGTRTGS
jgi:TIR domain